MADDPQMKSQISYMLASNETRTLPLLFSLNQGKGLQHLRLGNTAVGRLPQTYYFHRQSRSKVDS